MSKFLVLGWIFSLGFSSIAQADDASAKAALEKAKSLFAQRSSTSLKSIDEAISVLSAAEGQAETKLLKYDILILESRALYFKGTHTSGEAAKKDIHSQGQAKADAAEGLSADYSEAPYFAGIHMARWGEANGIIASLKGVPTLKKYMSKAMDRYTRNDAEGESIDGFGPHRVLGRLYKKLPSAFGGSHNDSVKELEKAMKGAPQLALNVVYLADSLMKDGSDSEKATGQRILNDLLNQDPAKMNPERLVETTEEFALARNVLAGKDIP